MVLKSLFTHPCNFLPGAVWEDDEKGYPNLPEHTDIPSENLRAQIPSESTLNPHAGDATFERMQVLNSVLSILCVLGESLLLNRVDHTVWQNYLLSLLSYCLIRQGKNSSALRMRKQGLEEVSDGPEGFSLPANQKKTNHNEMRMTTIFHREKSMAPAKLNIFHVSLLSNPPVPL